MKVTQYALTIVGALAGVQAHDLRGSSVVLASDVAPQDKRTTANLLTSEDAEMIEESEDSDQKSTNTYSRGGFDVYEDVGCTHKGDTGSAGNEFDLHRNVSYDTCESKCVSLGGSCYGFEYKQNNSRCEVWKVEISRTNFRSFSGKKCYIKKEKAPVRSVNADPNTALGRRQAFDKNDFVFDLAGSTAGSETPAGRIQSLDVAQLPSLAGQGVSYALITLEPCGINLPHVHPRATELIYVISGTNLRTAFVEENGGRGVIVNDIRQGFTTFFPQGLLHYQQNLSCERAQYIAALNHEDPGVITVATQFFSLPEEAIEGSLGQDSYEVQRLIDGLPAGPADGRKSCLIDCGLSA